jgi:hypothetical protein
MESEPENARATWVVITHTIRTGSDEAFLSALRRLHDARRSRGLVTDQWLVLRDRDRDDTYLQILEYVSPEAEKQADESPELALIRRELGAVSAGRPDHIWATLMLST